MKKIEGATTVPMRIRTTKIEELRKIAASEDRSIAYIINKMIDEGIERSKRKK